MNLSNLLILQALLKEFLELRYEDSSIPTDDLFDIAQVQLDVQQYTDKNFNEVAQKAAWDDLCKGGTIVARPTGPQG